MYEVDLVKIGKFINKIRTEKGLSQVELGKKVGVSDKTISKWENGSSFPDVLYERTLCDSLGIYLEELHNGDYNYQRRRKDKSNIIFKRIVISLTIIVIPLLIFLSIYFILHYKSMKIYQISSKDAQEDSCAVFGMVMESYSTNIIVTKYR